MNEEYNPSDSLSGEDMNVPSADGIENDSDVVSEAVSSATPIELKDALSKATGRTFTDNESALKAVQDTFNFVGKVGKYRPQIEKLEAVKGGEKNAIKYMDEIINEPVAEVPAQAPAVDTSQFVSKDEFEREMYFKDNPDLAPHRDLLTSLQKGTGKSLPEVAEMDSVKSVLSKAKAYDEVESSKSVLHSNPRLGQVTDKMTQASEAVKAGDHVSAGISATQAVMEAYDIGK